MTLLCCHLLKKLLPQNSRTRPVRNDGLENQLLLISINFTPKTSHSCLKKWYFPMFSRGLEIDNGALSRGYVSFRGCQVWFETNLDLGSALPLFTRIRCNLVYFSHKVSKESLKTMLFKAFKLQLPWDISDFV